MSENNVYKLEQLDPTSWKITDADARFFLFVGTEKALLVDSGHGSGDLKKAIEQVTKLPVMLVNTHADHDHIRGNAQFECAYMHPSEFALYRSEIVRLNISISREHTVLPLWEGDIIDLGNRSLEVILIPGHTPGSIALLDAFNRILLAGDSILDDRIAMGEPSRDLEAYLCSMEKLNGMRDRFDVVYTPHGGFPVGADILEGLISGAKRCLSGEVEGIETDIVKNAKLYDIGVAKFVY